MNAGLSNLDLLKKHLLAATLGTDPQFDTLIAAIGLGVAGMMEQTCNRKFARAAGAQEEFPGDRASFILSRFPIESVTALDSKNLESDSWTSQDTGLIKSISASAGLIYLADSHDPGAYWSKVRFTFTGGYWWETAEPNDAGYPSTLPEGAHALPDDLRLAWLLQCREVWNKIDKLNTGLIDKPDAQTNLAGLELSPLVKQMLTNYVVMQLV